MQSGGQPDRVWSRVEPEAHPDCHFETRTCCWSDRELRHSRSESPCQKAVHMLSAEPTTCFIRLAHVALCPWRALQRNGDIRRCVLSDGCTDGMLTSLGMRTTIGRTAAVLLLVAASTGSATCKLHTHAGRHLLQTAGAVTSATSNSGASASGTQQNNNAASTTVNSVATVQIINFFSAKFAIALVGRNALAERLCNRLHSGTCTAHQQLWTCYRTSSRRYSSAHYRLALDRPERLRSSRDSLLLWSGQPQHR